MNPQVKRVIREWVETIVIALALAMLVRTFVVAAFKIPTGSMKPTLLEGDKIFVSKFLYKFKSPQRGDVIVFKYPEDPKKDYVKRLIAFGDEKIEIKDGHVYVDGEQITDPHIEQIYYRNSGIYGAKDSEIEIPEDSFFVLGDNSANSRDSRYWGFVPKKNLVGKAFLIWWPPNRIRIIK
jgi:signal peptidase I